MDWRHVEPVSGAPRAKFLALQDLYYSLVIALIQIGGWCPSWLKQLVVRVTALTAYTFSRTKRQAMRRNLLRAFEGSLQRDRERAIIKGAFLETWEEIFSWVPNRSERAAITRTRLCGVEQLRCALERGKGVILWESAGFGRRVVAKRALHENGFSIRQVHGANDLGGLLTNNPASRMRARIIRRFFDRCERAFTVERIDLSSSRSFAITRRLRAQVEHNAILCITGDGKMGRKLLPVQMLGVTEFFATGMVTLARQSGAAILPMFCLEHTAGEFTLIIEDPLEIDTTDGRSDALQKAVKQYAGLLETYVRHYPERYRNWHLLGTPVI